MYNINNYNFSMCGAWINLNGDIHWTNNIESHSRVINELSIRNDLLDQRSILNWTSYELSMNFNYDCAYIAMKLGYIRIIVFDDQIGIESGIHLSEFSNNQKNSVISVIERYKMRINYITFEIFESQFDTYRCYDSINEFLIDLN